MQTLINTYQNESEAFIDKGFLESQGIPAEVESDALSHIYPSAGNVNLYVPSVLAVKARQLLESRR